MNSSLVFVVMGRAAYNLTDCKLKAWMISVCVCLGQVFKQGECGTCHHGGSWVRGERTRGEVLMG